MTFTFGLTLYAVVALSVASGLALFQYVVLPIGNGIVQLKELINERGKSTR